MSQILEKPTTTRSASPTRRAIPARNAPVSTVPDITLNARVYERKRFRSGVGSLVAQKALLFGLCMGLTYAAVSLSGQVMVESARQQRLEAHGRAIAAQTAEETLSVKVDRLASSAAIDAYAIAAKMSPSGEVTSEKPKETRVAFR